jgi:hypothetical protein
MKTHTAMSLIAGVFGAFVAVLSAGTLQAGTTVYNANGDLTANMAQTTPTAVYGVWSFGQKATAAGALDTASMAVVRGYGEGPTAPWGDAFKDASDSNAVKIVVNSTGSPQNDNWVVTRDADALFMINGATWLEKTLPVVRFTAPSDGTATLSGLLKEADWGTNSIDVLHNGTLLYSGTFAYNTGDWGLDGWGAGPRLQNLVGPVVMAGGDTLDVVLGNGAPLWSRAYMSESVSFDAIPEPSSVVLLVLALVGLLAYASRKRK